MPPKKGPRIRWDEAKEASLLEIIEHGENGQIRKVIQERATNIKLKFEDAWALVAILHNVGVRWQDEAEELPHDLAPPLDHDDRLANEKFRPGVRGSEEAGN